MPVYHDLSLVSPLALPFFKCSSRMFVGRVLTQMAEKLPAGGFSESEVLRIFCDVCEAVSHLHHSQPPIVHRDIKVQFLDLNWNVAQTCIHIFVGAISFVANNIPSNGHVLPATKQITLMLSKGLHCWLQNRREATELDLVEQTRHPSN